MEHNAEVPTALYIFTGSHKLYMARESQFLLEPVHLSVGKPD
jgi:hypothetical protein